MIIETAIQGDPGSGRTTTLLKQVAGHNKAGRRCLVVVPTDDWARECRRRYAALAEAGVEFRAADGVFLRAGLQDDTWDLVALDDGDRFPIAASGAQGFALNRVREYFQYLKPPRRYGARFLLYTSH